MAPAYIHLHSYFLLLMFVYTFLYYSHSSSFMHSFLSFIRLYILALSFHIYLHVSCFRFDEKICIVSWNANKQFRCIFELDQRIYNPNIWRPWHSLSALPSFTHRFLLRASHIATRFVQSFLIIQSLLYRDSYCP